MNTFKKRSLALVVRIAGIVLIAGIGRVITGLSLELVAILLLVAIIVVYLTLPPSQ